jgi:hypothetical protein
MVSEVSLFLLALFAILLAFASGISVIKHDQKDFAGIHKGILVLLDITMRMFDCAHYEYYESDPWVLTCVFVFMVAVVVFLLNMLVAQFTWAYEAVCSDMIGYARLERMEIIVGHLPVVSQKRRSTFLDALKLEAKVEFNAGDIGVNGGMQILEAANLNPTTTDMIKRFGGSASVEMQWPNEQEGQGTDEADRFERLENLIQKTLKRIIKGGSGGKGRGGSCGGSSTGSNSNDMDEDDDGDEGGASKSSSEDDAGDHDA